MNDERCHPSVCMSLLGAQLQQFTDGRIAAITLQYFLSDTPKHQTHGLLRDWACSFDSDFPAHV